MLAIRRNTQALLAEDGRVLKRRRGLLQAQEMAIIVRNCSSSGSYIIHCLAEDDKTLRIWNAEDGSVREIDPNFQTSVGAIAWRADGRFIAAGCNDGTVRVMDRVNDSDPMFFSGD